MQNNPPLDYRNDCWKGYKDVRLRLKQMAAGKQFSFVVSAKTAERMDRVVMINDGKVVTKQRHDKGDVVYTVEKS